MWSKNLCVNASTGELHMDKDTSYMPITVPLKYYKLQQKCGNVYKFIFEINDNKYISLPSFMFSVTFISHCQAGNTSTDKENNHFVNLSSYEITNFLLTFGNIFL